MSELATMRIRERGSFTIATIAGEIDVSNSTRLLGRLTSAVGNGASGLLLDLGTVDFVDSSGVHMLYDLADRLTRRQQRFAVVMPPDRAPRRVVELTGHAADWVHADAASALEALGA